MIRVPRTGTYVLVTIACLGEIGCQVQLRRPNTTPTRMIEPQVLEPQQSVPAAPVKKAANATPIRLLDTQALGHIASPVAPASERRVNGGCCMAMVLRS
jgi:hypothetical protein